MSGLKLRWLVLALLAVMLFSVPQVGAQGTIYVVTPDNTQGWYVGPDTSLPNTPIWGFVDDNGNPGPGSLRAEIVAPGGNKLIVARQDFSGIPLRDFNLISYRTFTDPTATNVNQIYLNLYVNADNAPVPAYDYRLDFAPTGTRGLWQTWTITPTSPVWRVYSRTAGTWVAHNVSINDFLSNSIWGCGACTNPTIFNPWNGAGASIVFNAGDSAANYVGFKGNLDFITINMTGRPIVSYDFEPPASGFFCYNDGRENALCWEPWATAAVYCTDAGIDVYAIDADGHGTLVIRATPDDVQRVGIGEEPRLIASSPDDMIRLYRLDTGEFQVNSPMDGDLNGYVFIWDGCGF